jgi:hypothetical protein
MGLLLVFYPSVGHPDGGRCISTTFSKTITSNIASPSVGSYIPTRCGMDPPSNQIEFDVVIVSERRSLAKIK